MTFRKLVIGDETYEYFIGKSYVKIKEVATVRIPEMLGLTEEQFEKMRYKHSLQVTPQDIKDYILKEK